MAERPKWRLDKHPLWPLYSFIGAELWEVDKRLWSTDYQDRNEADFQVFLQDEAKERLSREMATDSEMPLPRSGLQKPVIADPVTRKKYEAGWKNLFLKARIKPLDKTTAMREIDSLFAVWKNAPKITVNFSLN